MLSPFVMQKGFFYMWKSIDKYLLWLTGAWVLVIFILCATPGQYIPNFAWLDLLSFDKFVHASMFFTLTALLMRLSEKHQLSPILLTLFAVLYGISLEIMQAKVFVNRSADINDIIANSFGCLMALISRKKYLKFYRAKLEITQEPK